MKYTIVHINNRSKGNMERTNNILYSFEYVDDIKFFDGRKINARKIIEDMGVPIKWNPYDGRTTDPLSAEFGVWLSNISIYKYIVKNKITEMLILEDDAILSDNFVNIFLEALREAPSSYDFISLYNFEDQNQEDERTNLGKKYIHKSINQYSAFQGIVISYSGAKKILRLLKKEGIEYTVDCQVFRKSLEEKLNGYSLKPLYKIIKHDKNVESLIDNSEYRYI